MVEQNEYTEQAERFLQENGITFSAEFVEYGRFFADDKESRNIYDLTLTRIDPNKAKTWSKSMTVRFGQSIADTESGVEPEAYDLLSCLTKSGPGSFPEFCSEFGYDEDSRNAYAAWEAVCKEWHKVSHFFSPEEIESLYEIQ